MSDAITRLRAVWQAVSRQGAVGLGAVLLGIAAIISSGGWLHTEVTSRAAEDDQRDHLDDLRTRNRALTRQLTVLTEELACRSEAATEASNIQGQMTSEIGAGLAALARDDETAFLLHADAVEQLSAELGPALERRSEAVEACAGGGDPPAVADPPEPHGDE